MGNITIAEEELLKLLETAYEEGWYGSKDMGETVAQKLVKDIKAPEHTHSGGPELAKQLIKECESYYRPTGETLDGYDMGIDPPSFYPPPADAAAWRLSTPEAVHVSHPNPMPDFPQESGFPSDHANHLQQIADADALQDLAAGEGNMPNAGPDGTISAWQYHQYTAGVDNIQVADAIEDIVDDIDAPFDPAAFDAGTANGFAPPAGNDGEDDDDFLDQLMG